MDKPARKIRRMDGKRPRVLFLPSWYPGRLDPLSGIFVRKHAQCAAKFADVAVLFVAPDPDLSKKASDMECTEENGVITVRVYYEEPRVKAPLIRRFIGMIRYLKAEWTGYKMAASKLGTPEVVHLNVAFPAGLPALLLKKLKRIPYVITEHSTSYLEADGSYARTGYLRKFVTKLIFGHSAATSAVSAHLSEALKGDRLTHGDSFVIPNVVEVCEEAARRENHGSRAKILTISALNDEHKNVSGLIKVFSVLAGRQGNAELHIVGDGKDRNKLEELAREKGVLGKSVFFRGAVANNQLSTLFAESDFFALNSNYETFSVAAAEAIAHGVPVVITKCGGPEEFVTDAVGIQVEKDESSLLSGMEYMMKNRGKYDPGKLRAYAKERFDSTAISRAFQRMYALAPLKDIFKVPALRVGDKRLEYYQGSLIKADSRLHSQVTAELLRNKMDAASVLDFGCGEGALSQRLSDLGYEVLSADLDEASFKAQTKFMKINFNDPAQMETFRKESRHRFDAVLSVETIEHLENPGLYLDTMREVIKPGGLLVLTTPNISSWRSRVFFLYRGILEQFAENDLKGYGHINPTGILSVSHLLEERGFEILSLQPGGTLSKLWLTGRIRADLLSLAGFLLRPLMRGFKDGWCVVITARKLV